MGPKEDFMALKNGEYLWECKKCHRRMRGKLPHNATRSVVMRNIFGMMVGKKEKVTAPCDGVFRKVKIDGQK